MRGSLGREASVPVWQRRAARLLVVALATLGTTTGAAIAQDDPPPASPESPPPAPGATRLQTAFFQVDLPDDWRQLMPNESLALRETLPWDFPIVQPGITDIFGPVDRWRESGFVGGALVVHRSDFEGEATPGYLAQVRGHWEEFRFDNGGRREVLAAQVGTLGRNDHPCLELELRSTAPDARPTHALEFHASTTGQELILSFRTWDDDYREVESTLRGIAATFTFPRPPNDPKDLGSRLSEAAWIGALVGLALIALRRGLRGRSFRAPTDRPNG